MRDQVEDYVQQVKQQLVNLTSAHATFYARIETVKVKYDRIMKHYVKNSKALEYRLKKLMEAKEYAVQDRAYRKAEHLTNDIAVVSADLHRLQTIINGNFHDVEDEEQGVKYVHMYSRV